MVLGTWNSLEAAKIFVGILTPLTIFVLGVWVAREAREWDQRQWLRRTHYERRLRFWDEMGPALNDLYCFFALVGRYRDVTPPRAIELKRDVDSIFFGNEHLFPKAVGAAYKDFIDACFSPYSGGRATDALLRSSVQDQQDERRTWDPSWNPLFTSEQDVSSRAEIRTKYQNLVRLFTTDDL